jgi:hypothetical protein
MLLQVMALAQRALLGLFAPTQPRPRLQHALLVRSPQQVHLQRALCALLVKFV